MMSGQVYFALLNPAIAFTFAAVFLLLWRRIPDRRHLLLVVFAFVACGLGFVLRDFPLFEEIATRWWSNLMFLVCAVLACASATALAGRDVPWMLLGLIAAAGFALFGWYLLVEPSTLARIVIMGVTMALMALTTIVSLVRIRPLALSGRIVLVAVIAGLILALVRPILTLSGALPLNDGDTFQQSTYWVTVQAFTPIFSGAIALLFLAAMSIDTFEQLRTEANHDYLTGLLNRRGFEKAVTTALARSGDRRPALIMGDIDNFKTINDSFGHKVGDQVIAGVARALSSHGNALFAARVGGEEFALYYPDTVDLALNEQANRIRLAIGQVHSVGLPAGYPLTISIGVHPRAEGQTLAEMLIECDRALYLAKNTGKNRAVHSADLPRRQDLRTKSA